MRKMLERIFDWLDKKLHETTYNDLDYENSMLQIKIDDLQDQLEGYKEIEEARNEAKRATSRLIWW